MRPCDCGDSGGIEAAANFVSGDAGAEAAGLFYDELAQVKAEELRLLDLRRVDESSRNGSAPLSFGLVLMIGLGILGYIGTVAVRRSNVVLRTETLQSAIFNRANFSSIATDARGVIQIFNVGAERMLGYTAAEVMNKLWDCPEKVDGVLVMPR